MLLQKFVRLTDISWYRRQTICLSYRRRQAVQSRTSASVMMRMWRVSHEAKRASEIRVDAQMRRRLYVSLISLCPLCLVSAAVATTTTTRTRPRVPVISLRLLSLPRRLVPSPACRANQRVGAAFALCAPGRRYIKAF